MNIMKKILMFIYYNVNIMYNIHINSFYIYKNIRFIILSSYNKLYLMEKIMKNIRNTINKKFRNIRNFVISSIIFKIINNK